MNNAQALRESTFKPSVEYQPHNKLETEVKAYLESKGFICHESTYHSIMPSYLRNILQMRFSLTALYIRGRADRLAIHQELPIEFEWEAKTHARKDKHDLTLEALPIIHHIAKSQLGVKCLYVARVNGRDIGFWINELPDIRCAFLPLRKEYKSIKERIKSYLQYYFPGKNIVEWKVNGSGDPFLIIDKSELNKLQDWRTLVDNLTS